jgi:hypothetical protein
MGGAVMAARASTLTWWKNLLLGRSRRNHPSAMEIRMLLDKSADAATAAEARTIAAQKQLDLMRETLLDSGDEVGLRRLEADLQAAMAAHRLALELVVSTHGRLGNAENNETVEALVAKRAEVEKEARGLAKDAQKVDEAREELVRLTYKHAVAGNVLKRLCDELLALEKARRGGGSGLRSNVSPMDYPVLFAQGVIYGAVSVDLHVASGGRFQSRSALDRYTLSLRQRFGAEVSGYTAKLLRDLPGAADSSEAQAPDSPPSAA